MADMQGVSKGWQEVWAVVGVVDEAAWQAVAGESIVIDVAGEMAEETAVAILTRLEQEDLPRYRLLHERAVRHLGERLEKGERYLEDYFVAAFERLANRLLLDDTEALIALVEQTSRLPLHQLSSQQQLRYFEGLVLFKREQYAAAVALLANLVATNPTMALRARALNSQAVGYFYLGRLEEAQAGYEASLALWQELGDKKYEGTVRLNLGIIAYDLRRYTEAQDHLRQAEAIFKRLGATAWLAAVQNELGVVYRDLGRWAEALAYFNGLIAVRRAEGADEHVAIGLLNRGEVLLFEGRMAEAVGSLAEALALMPTAIYRVDIYLHLGLAYQAMGEWMAAYSAFADALQVAEEIERRDILPQVYYRLGDWCIRQGELERGKVWLETAVSIIEDTREPMRDEGFKISLMGKWQQVYERLVLLCLQMGEVAAGFAWMERARARAFTELLLAMDEVAEEVPISTLADVQAVLPTGVRLLCYFTTGVLAHDVPLLQAVPMSNPLREQLLVPAQTLVVVVDRKTAVFHDCRFDPNLFTSASRRGDEHLLFLEERVLAQLRQMLVPEEEREDGRGEREDVVVVPHGPLYRVPFAALLAGVQMQLAPSGGVLRQHYEVMKKDRERPSTTKSALAVGYNGVWRGQALQFTEVEVQVVAELMGGEAWVGRETKKERLRQMAESVRFLHVACHGWFDYERPLQSYIETGEGERLTAQEVRQHWRLQAELVVLSACQTGVSAVLRGDEPMGLIRAFLSAGARAVLVSQWPVADLPTFLLMQDFYGRLQAGMSASEALNLAQSWLRELTIAEAVGVVKKVVADEGVQEAALAELRGMGTAVPYAHPQFWAAFVVVNGR